MTKKNSTTEDAAIEAELQNLGTLFRQHAPRPDDDLMARVLADAGRTAFEHAQQAPQASARQTRRNRPKLQSKGWFWGVTGWLVAMSLCLAIGLGAGLELGDSAIADEILAQNTTQTTEITDEDTPFSDFVL